MVKDIQMKDSSVLPMPLQNPRFLILESLLQRLERLPQHAIVTLIDIVTPTALTAFADHFSLLGDGWEFANNENEQRELIKGAIEIHRHKGTPWAIKRTLQLLGYGDCELQERFSHHKHNGQIRHNGHAHYASIGAWTHYRLLMQKRITLSEAERIRVLLTNVAPLRCKLVSINLNNFYHNSVIRHNATHRYNEVIAKW
ncbi:phage tail protein [Acinetobacter sp. c3-l95]|uniref:phage tail protein n=1 Tax=Acinetobacter sp. c3-l95 TaxID=3342804 RepID=UPI0035B6EDC6